MKQKLFWEPAYHHHQLALRHSVWRLVMTSDTMHSIFIFFLSEAFCSTLLFYFFSCLFLEKNKKTLSLVKVQCTFCVITSPEIHVKEVGATLGLVELSEWNEQEFSLQFSFFFHLTHKNFFLSQPRNPLTPLPILYSLYQQLPLTLNHKKITWKLQNKKKRIESKKFTSISWSFVWPLPLSRYVPYKNCITYFPCYTHSHSTHTTHVINCWMSTNMAHKKT